ncbi:hypothetical protein KR51_00001870 [Rubidibacter lacunae KORDI 51-2]|uniref:Uncharacterized protein n=1 Tax=Rubidibacter lacunae KORDI 51-2 TaxID=582515 RepID=U5DPU6_9CHRO|nr:hypothetical protein [Rubidibacter lacunae]ERN42892.1 hypothetical protein KR51_00001870 [Rubidibacter lacunae KORDI 51-2]
MSKSESDCVREEKFGSIITLSSVQEYLPIDRRALASKHFVNRNPCAGTLKIYDQTN